MRKLALFRVGVLAPLFVFAAMAGRAQSDATAPPSAPPTPKQTSASGAAPAATAAPAAKQAQSVVPANDKTPRVWTNDEIDTLRRESSVSIVGENVPQKAASASAKAKGYSLEKDPNWYRKQLQPLQVEIDKLDAQIEKTKAFLSGERVSDPPASQDAYYGFAGNPQEQLQQLESQRDKDVAKVNDLLDRARHNDIRPGDLR